MNYPEIQKGIISLLRNDTDNTAVMLFRYILAGGFAFIIDFLCLVFLTEVMHIPYLYSAGVAFLIGIIVIYLLTIRWVFQVNRKAYHHLGIFIFTGVTGLLLNQVVIYAATEYGGIHYSVSKLISAGIVFFWNFLSRRMLLDMGEKKIE